MTKRQNRWISSPSRPTRPRVTDNVKADVERKAAELVEKVLKPQHIKPPPEDVRFNYIVDIYTRWHGNYFYFCAKYHSPGPNAISPFFEVKFARLEYVGGSHFNLSFMRHTGQWVEVYTDCSLDECLSAIREDAFFQP
jgi:hypothetical protein